MIIPNLRVSGRVFPADNRAFRGSEAEDLLRSQLARDKALRTLQAPNDDTATSAWDQGTPSTDTPLKPSQPQPGPRNVVFFGETGVGKSSIINMLREISDSPPSPPTNPSPEETPAPPEKAAISNGALGCTVANTSYTVYLSDPPTPDSGNSEPAASVQYTLWDTAGLVEGESGSVVSGQAEENLARLLEKVGGGVSLLVFCIRGRRFRAILQHHYDLIYRRTCWHKRVPIILVVNGLENETGRMDDWWATHRVEFKRNKMRFERVACVVSTRGKAVKGGGKGHILDEEYEVSLQVLRAIIRSKCLEKGKTFKKADLIGGVAQQLWDLVADTDDESECSPSPESNTGLRPGEYAPNSMENEEEQVLRQR
ncbi:hypothetical protein DFP72DRAFT_536609 [Ephemerocybe angulata]|uniref:G domain-containing protein n=1 Tax=Ephemerocybe angulata TaxID=980116 RepID=A0A8H6HNA7_9AGAR|nr:hypothetical protein DFP72DRAFT_536609 [Tulosesus angulatus]